MAECDAQAARLQESLLLGTEEDAVVDISESDEDDERTALDSAFHSMRIDRVATFRHFQCCPNCAEEELSEYVGWVLFTIADTDVAIKTGWLTLRFGSNSMEYDIGRWVCDGLWNMGFTLTWDDDETPVDVLLKEDSSLSLSEIGASCL